MNVLNDNAIGKITSKEPPRPLTVEEAADFCRMSKHKIYKLTSAKRIPHFKRSARCLFDKRELLDWLKSGR